jgi:hypothetical protein
LHTFLLRELSLASTSINTRIISVFIPQSVPQIFIGLIHRGFSQLTRYDIIVSAAWYIFGRWKALSLTPLCSGRRRRPLRVRRIRYWFLHCLGLIGASASSICTGLGASRGITLILSPLPFAQYKPVEGFVSLSQALI